MQAVSTRRHLPCVLLIAALAGFYLPWSWSDQLGTLGGDAAIYVMTARSYAPYLPVDPVAQEVARNSQFPPLYPLLLAASGGAAGIHQAHVVTTLCLLWAFAALYAWLLALGVAPAAATVGVALVALLPETLLQALYVHSESLYVALNLTLLAVLGRADAGTPARSFWIATVLCAALVLTRSAGVAMLPAFVIALLRRRPAGWIGMLALALAPALAWAALHRPEQDYADGLTSHYLGMSWPELGWSLAYDTVSIALGLAKNIVPTGALLWAAAALGAGVLIVAGVRAWQARVDAWYLLAYLALVTVWPYPEEDQRLVWVVMPIMIGYAIWVGTWMAATIRTEATPLRAAIRWLVPVALALTLTPGLHLLISRYQHPDARETPALRHLPDWYGADPAAAKRQAGLELELIEAVTELSALLPQTACLFSIKPAVAAYLGGRRGVGLPPAQADDANFRAWVQDRGCDYFLLLDLVSPTYSAPYYPLDRLQGELEIVAVRTSKQSASKAVIAALARRTSP